MNPMWLIAGMNLGERVAQSGIIPRMAVPVLECAVRIRDRYREMEAFEDEVRACIENLPGTEEK